MLPTALAAVGVAALFTWPFQGVTQTETSSYPIKSHGTLTVETASGDIAVRTWGGNTVDIVVHKRAADKPTLSSLKVESSTADGNVGLKAIYPRSCENCDISFEINVPKNVSVVAETASGAIHAANVGGELALKDESGDITVEHAAGAVSTQTASGDIRVDGVVGPLTCKAASGRIRVTGASRDVDAHSASGDVSARFASLSAVRSIALGSVSGSIELAVPRGTGLMLKASTISGSIANDFGGQIQAGLAGAQLAQTIGDGRVRVQIEVTSGDVKVRAI